MTEPPMLTFPKPSGHPEQVLTSDQGKRVELGQTSFRNAHQYQVTSRSEQTEVRVHWEVGAV